MPEGDRKYPSPRKVAEHLNKPDSETLTTDQIGSTDPPAINRVETEGWEGEDEDDIAGDLDSAEQPT